MGCGIVWSLLIFQDLKTFKLLFEALFEAFHVKVDSINTKMYLK